MKPVFGMVEQPQSFFRINRKDKYQAEFLWHFHHVYELNLIIKGRGTRFVGDSIQHYEAGDLVLMAPNLPHTWYGDPRLPDSRKPHYSIGLQFSAAFIGASLETDPDWAHIRRLLEKAGRGISFRGAQREAAIKKITMLEQLKGPARLVSFLEVLELLTQAKQQETLSNRTFEPQHPANEKRIDKVRSHVSQNYTHPLTLEEIAAVAELSVPTFCRFFKATTGRTFTAYVNELRIGLACKLLVETEARVSDIAYDAGFGNLSNFNRRFLGLKKVSPLTYRKQYLERGEVR